ncbi:hypothetical protein [Legionella wadsworthii]|nr:hypothetical protein [Legionella wadsworthii]
MSNQNVPVSTWGFKHRSEDAAVLCRNHTNQVYGTGKLRNVCLPGYRVA